MTSIERLVLDALPEAVYAADLEGRITLAGGQAGRGAGGAAPTGRAIWEQLADVATREELQHAMDALRTGRATTVRWERQRGGAETAVSLVQAGALHDGRAVSGFVFAVADVTPGHRSREALIDASVALAHTVSLDRVLQEVTHQLRHVTACDGLAIALVDGNDDAPHLAHHSGLDGDGATIEAELAPAWREALAQGRTVTRQTPRGLEITAPMAGAEGAVGAVTLAAEQVEPHEAAETELALSTIAAEAAASVERARVVRRLEQRRRLEAIGEVAAGVAGELRNPLFGISSAAQLLRFRVKEDPVVERNVGRILREVERLNAMVTSLLEYGRPAPAKLRDADPDAVWDEVLAAQRGALEAKALTVARTRPKTHVTCRVDPEQLGHAFQSVLANAIDAAPEGTDLTLASEATASRGWRSRLHNAGAPIPADALPRVFELFFSTKPGSTGIGLALCERILDEHGGSVSIESKEGKGTTVTMSLPGV
jgi:signal transduction histidine kinase